MHKQTFQNRVVFAILLIISISSQATLITVTANHGLVAVDGVCSISEAIIAANTDTASNECPAGSGTDTIELTQDVTLSVHYNFVALIGRTGTPAITSSMTLDGKGFTLQRDSSLACTFNNNSSVEEFRLLRTTAPANLTLQNISIANGCTDGSLGSEASGGGLLNQGNLSLDKVVFKQNKASNIGGGLYNDEPGGTLSIQNSLFDSNESNLGGGISNIRTITLIQNSTFSGNSAARGGAILSFAGVINTIQNSTFSGNSASFFGAIFNDTSTINNIQNSLFHNNSGNDCSPNFLGNNNISDKGASGCNGSIATVLDPATIGPLADNGGPTFTHALLAGSQAIDAGDSSASATDQRGFTANGVRDIGAYEIQAIELCPSALMTDGFNTVVNDAAELIQAIECANANGQANGGDTINLNADITLLQAYENDAVYSRTGTPAISTAITLDGNGFILQRDASLICNLDFTSTADEFRVFRTTTSANLILQDITIANGCNDSNGGAGIARASGGLLNQGTLSLDRVVLKQNKSMLQGGGLYNDINGTVSSIKNSLFYQNSASRGGGFYNSGTVTLIENSTFSGNSSQQGGAIYNKLNTIISLQNSTFSNNSATVSTGAIEVSAGSIDSLQNSLFLNNGSSECSGAITGINNISDNNLTACNGSIATLLDPNTIAPLADNGGATLTHALLAGSQALNIGDSNSTTTDQRGFVADGIRDLGAFEAQIPVVTAPADIVIEATGATTIVSLGSATVVDVDEAGLTATADMSGPFTVGIHTITWSVVDSQGFVGSDTQTVTITDTTAPIIIAPTNIMIEATGATTAVTLGTATAIDLVDGSLIPTADMSSPFAVGIYNITWSATDNAGNTGTATQIVNVQAVISGSINGLNGTVTLQNNGSDNINLNANGGFRFATPLDNLSMYAATVLTQPATQSCSVTNASGQVNGNGITDIVVNCVDNTLGLDASSLDYGIVFTGDSSTQTVVLTNTGSGDVIISSISNPATPFTIIGGSCFALPMTLMATQSCDLIIEFSPNNIGSFTSSFNITSNIPASPTVINLLGSSAVRIIPTLNFYGLLLMMGFLLGVVFFRSKEST